MNNSPAPANKRSRKLKRWLIGILTIILLTALLGVCSLFSWHPSERPRDLMDSNTEFFIFGSLLRKTYNAFAIAQQQQKNEVTLLLEPREVKALISRALKQYYRNHQPDQPVIAADYKGDQIQIFASQPVLGKLAVHLKMSVKILWDGTQWKAAADSPQLGWWTLSTEMVENYIQAELSRQIKSAPGLVKQVLKDSTIEPLSDGSVQIVCRSPQIIMQLLQKLLFR